MTPYENYRYAKLSRKNMTDQEQKKPSRGRQKHKDSSVYFKLSTEEKKELMAQAKNAGVSLSEFLRSKVVIVKTEELKECQKERNRTLANLANNMNQIARHCNTYKSETDAEKIASYLLGVGKKLDELIAKK